jgi:hypothetical protein
MKSVPLQPCPAWATRLAARHPSDLSSAESAELAVHLRSCPACAEASAAYSLMETAIRELPPVAPLAVFSTEQLEEANTHSDPQLTAEAARRPVRALRTRSHLSRTARVVNLLAAVLVVCVLIVGSLLLFTTHRSPGAQGGAVGSVDLPPQPIPGGLCENADPGLKTLCGQHQLTKIDMTKKVGSTQLTLAYAYADSNRIALLAFAPLATLYPSPSVHSNQLLMSDLTLANGQHLDELGGSGFVAGKYEGFLTNVDAATLPGSTHTLHLRLAVSFVDRPQSTKPTATVTFAFSVPFHPARIAHLHKTLTIAGQSITLDRVVISPSAARVYLQGGPKVPGSPTELKVGRIDENTADGGWQPSTTYTTDALFEYDVSLYNQAGEWTFIITPPGPAGGTLTYTFHFLVPQS